MLKTKYEVEINNQMEEVEPIELEEIIKNLKNEKIKRH